MHGKPGTAGERTFLMVKPEGVARGLVSEIIGRWEKRGYTLVGIKVLQPDAKLAGAHYADLSARPFFKDLVHYMSSSGPVVAMVWQGKDVIKVSRDMIGMTNPLTSAPGTIRGDLAVNIGRNVIHGSDGVEGGASCVVDLALLPALCLRMRAMNQFRVLQLLPRSRCGFSRTSWSISTQPSGRSTPASIFTTRSRRRGVHDRSSKAMPAVRLRGSSLATRNLWGALLDQRPLRGCVGARASHVACGRAPPAARAACRYSDVHKVSLPTPSARVHHPFVVQ